MSTNSSRQPSGQEYAWHPTGASPLTDSELWRRLRLREEQAVADLYDRYSQLIYSVAYQVLHDPGTSEDVLQEVFLHLWRVPEAFEPAKGSLRAWLTVVSRRRAIDRLRTRKTEIDINDVIVSIGATQLADAARNQLTGKISTLLKDMPEKLRVTFELAYVKGLTHSEISEELGDPLGTTKTRIRQALDFVRKKLNSTGENANGNGHVR